MIYDETLLGSAFSPVTKEADGLSVGGKYSFPPEDRTELKGMDYPFPTILTRENANVHVHYGEWPVQGIVRKDNTDKYLGSEPISLSLFAGGTHTETLTLEGVGVDGATLAWKVTGGEDVVIPQLSNEAGNLSTLRVTGKKVGSAKITVTCTVTKGTTFKTYTLDIVVNVASGLTLETEPKTLVMFPGDAVTVPLKVNGTLTGNRELTASGGNGLAATVTEDDGSLYLNSGDALADTAVVNVSGSYQGHPVSGAVIVTRKELPELVAVEGKESTYSLTFEGASVSEVVVPEGAEVKAEAKDSMVTLSGLTKEITLTVTLTMDKVVHTVTMAVKPPEAGVPEP